MLIPFGQINVTTAGTPVRASGNQSDPTARVGLQSIGIQAKVENTGRIYIFQAGANGTANKTTRTTCVGFLPAPSDPVKGPFPSWSYSIPNVMVGLNLADFWLDADNNGEGVIVFGTKA